GRKGGVVVRIQTDYSHGGRLLRYSLALIDTHKTGVDDGRVIGYDNAHGHHHRHCDGKVEIVEYGSYESIEKRFEAEIREYLENRED
ncbi:MAG: toxin-antitoxin system TumE family protein, partial [Bryobacteraceae bacterium]